MYDTDQARNDHYREKSVSVVALFLFYLVVRQEAFSKTKQYNGSGAHMVLIYYGAGLGVAQHTSAGGSLGALCSRTSAVG